MASVNCVLPLHGFAQRSMILIASFLGGGGEDPMALVMVAPGRFVANAGLCAGMCTFDRRATCTLLASDLAVAGITVRVVVLVDPDAFRVALRAPRDGDDANTFAVSVVRRKGRDTGRRRIHLGRAIGELHLEASAVRGKHTVLAKGKDGAAMLTIPLLGDGEVEPAPDRHRATPRFQYGREEEVDENE